MREERRLLAAVGIVTALALGGCEREEAVPNGQNPLRSRWHLTPSLTLIKTTEIQCDPTNPKSWRFWSKSQQILPITIGPVLAWTDVRAIDPCAGVPRTLPPQPRGGMWP